MCGRLFSISCDRSLLRSNRYEVFFCLYLLQGRNKLLYSAVELCRACHNVHHRWMCGHWQISYFDLFDSLPCNKSSLVITRGKTGTTKEENTYFFHDRSIFHASVCFYSVTTSEPQLWLKRPWSNHFPSGKLSHGVFTGKRFTAAEAPSPPIKPIMSASDDGRGIGWHSGNLFTKSLKALIFAWGWRANCLVNRLHCIPLPQPVQGFCLCWRSASRILTWFLSAFCFMGRSSLPASLSEHIIVPLLEDGSVPSHLLFRPGWN